MYVELEQMKVCTGCGQAKPWSAFSWRSEIGRPRARCKACSNEEAALRASRRGGWKPKRKPAPALPAWAYPVVPAQLGWGVGLACTAYALRRAA